MEEQRLEQVLALTKGNLVIQGKSEKFPIIQATPADHQIAVCIYNKTKINNKPKRTTSKLLHFLNDLVSNFFKFLQNLTGCPIQFIGNFSLQI